MPASTAPKTAVIPPFAPKRTSSTETTLSLAMNPLISDVTILQSPRPRGCMMGAINPAIRAIIDVDESATRLNLRSKLWSAHTITVAMRITENAFCRKSFAFSHMSCNVLRSDGRR